MVCLTDKVVVITGASSGIGRAVAIEFAKKGGCLVLAARRIEKLQALHQHILSFNLNCIYVQTDVTREDDVVNLFTRAREKFGRVDILVNNAGRGLKSEVCDTNLEDWNSVIDANLTSVFLCSKQAVKSMKQDNIKGHIITVCSIAGLFGGSTYAAYCASKHGVNGFVKALKWEVRKYGIKVSTIYPARVDTEFFDSYKKKPGRNQMLSPKDIADYIVAAATRCPLVIAKAGIANFIKRICGFAGISFTKPSDTPPDKKG